MAQQCVVRGRDAEAQRARGEVHMEDEAVRNRGVRVPAREEDMQAEVEDERQRAGDQVREDVGGLVVQVQPATKARPRGREDGAVAGVDERVFAVPVRDLVDGKEHDGRGLLGGGREGTTRVRRRGRGSVPQHPDNPVLRCLGGRNEAGRQREDPRALGKGRSAQVQYQRTLV